MIVGVIVKLGKKFQLVPDYKPAILAFTVVSISLYALSTIVYIFAIK